MSIITDSQLLEPGAEIKLYKLDGTTIHPLAGIHYFHGHKHDGPITWQGIEYQPYPIHADGFAKTTDKPATPTLSAANLSGFLTAMCLQYDDMVGAILTIKTTLSKYLDAVNFAGGNPTADPNEEYPEEVWYIDRKEYEDHLQVKWALASALDFNGVQLPRRMIVANQCYWQYRSADCGYAGPPVADTLDVPTNDPAVDNCSRRVTGCKLRFGENAELPYGSFPAAGLMR